MFDVKEESTLKQGSFFINKIWNALKLVKQVWSVAGGDTNVPGFYKEGESPEISNWIPQPDNATFAIEWFNNRLSEIEIEVQKLFTQFRLSEALKTIYSLIWDDFCSSYLEWIKPDFGEKVDYDTYNSTISYFVLLNDGSSSIHAIHK